MTKKSEIKQKSWKEKIWEAFIPLVYLLFWYVIPILLGRFFRFQNLRLDYLIIGALPVLFIGIISKQTSWSIGGEKGIKGDNIGIKARATLDGRGSFDFEGIEIDEEKVNTIIKSVTKNKPLQKNSSDNFE